MRIKIIGENNCARATRHLLRLGGFAVTEFLPADALTSGPHAGYAITIDVAPGAAPPATPAVAPAAASPSDRGAALPHSDPAPADPSPDSRLRAPQREVGESGSCLRPDSPTHGHASAREEAPRAHRDASLPASSRTGFSLSGFASQNEASPGRGCKSEPPAAKAVPFQTTVGTAEAVPYKDLPVVTPAVKSVPQIHFDSVESALEAAVLRHVTQLAAAPVIVDRPGGVVHSDRELRIVAPNTGDAKADEAAAVAIEFGVLRGLLDLTSGMGMGLPGFPPQKSTAAPQAHSSESAEARGASTKKKWWLFGIVLLAVSCGAGVSPVTRVPGQTGRRLTQKSKTAGSSFVGVRGARATRLARPVAPALVEPDRLKPVLLAAQGQFATGQGFKITDGLNFLAIDPCKAQAKSYASISQTANAQLVAGTASKKIYVCSIHVVAAAATNVAVVEGTGSVCGTGTAGVSGFGGSTAATGWNFAANGGIALGNGDSSLGAEATSGDSLCIFNSGSGQVSGGISYVVE